MTDGKYTLVGQTPTPCEDLLEWRRWFEENDRRVGLTRVGPYFVSTIFLGLDHNWSHRGPPVLFETMIWVEMKGESPAITLPPTIGREKGITFPAMQWERDFLDEQRRCCTWLEAEAQHQAVVDELRGHNSNDEVEQLWPEKLEREEQKVDPRNEPC